MNDLQTPTRLDPQHTAQIMQKTEEAIEAYRIAGQQMRKVSRILGELQVMLPEGMCIRLPSGEANIYAHFEHIQQPTHPFDNLPQSDQLVSPSPIPSTWLKESKWGNIVPKKAIRFQESSMDEGESHDEFFLSPLADSASKTKKPRRKSKAKKKIRYKPYKKPSLSKSRLSLNEPQVLTRSRNKKNPGKSSTSGLQEKIILTLKQKPTKAKEQATSRSSSISTAKKSGPSYSKKPLTAEEADLVEELLKYMEPRLADGAISQKGIATEIRERSGFTSQIAQGTISKMLRRLEVPKDPVTIEAIRSWIAVEKSRNKTTTKGKKRASKK
ncbi:hypothetical protein G9A89_002301 [Geosiphon pyriformis]|nr:hypothetical protein G9A89_002301 [Geosiphon pyriformis]